MNLANDKFCVDFKVFKSVWAKFAVGISYSLTKQPITSHFDYSGEVNDYSNKGLK